ncbi:hypothetical protein V8C42DRAFT_135662 [Trichoderma barbatum]
MENGAHATTRQIRLLVTANFAMPQAKAVKTERSSRLDGSSCISRCKRFFRPTTCIFVPCALKPVQQLLVASWARAGFFGRFVRLPVQEDQCGNASGSVPFQELIAPTNAALSEPEKPAFSLAGRSKFRRLKLLNYGDAHSSGLASSMTASIQPDGASASQILVMMPALFRDVIVSFHFTSRASFPLIQNVSVMGIVVVAPRWEQEYEYISALHGGVPRSILGLPTPDTDTTTVRRAS